MFHHQIFNRNIESKLEYAIFETQPDGIPIMSNLDGLVGWHESPAACIGALTLIAESCMYMLRKNNGYVFASYQTDK